MVKTLEGQASQQLDTQYSNSSTKAHRTSMAIWEVPSPAEGGSEIGVKAGVKCEQGCNLAGASIEVMDDSGNQVWQGVLGKNPAPNTDALYWTRAAFAAPNEDGYHQWVARFPEKGSSSAMHSESRIKFGLLTVAHDFRKLTVEVVDGATKATLANAYVRIGANTQFTDEAGRATASVTRGGHELVVWKRDHKMFRTSITVEGDNDLKVELTPSPCKYCPDST